MKANCQYVDGVCSQCGKAGAGLRTCPAGRYGYLIKREPCPHLGEPTGASALVPCRSCCGNTRKKHPVHVCALHGDCVPGRLLEIVELRGKVQDGRKCVGCADNPNARKVVATPAPKPQS